MSIFSQVPLFFTEMFHPAVRNNSASSSPNIPRCFKWRWVIFPFEAPSLFSSGFDSSKIDARPTVYFSWCSQPAESKKKQTQGGNSHPNGELFGIVVLFFHSVLFLVGKNHSTLIKGIKPFGEKYYQKKNWIHMVSIKHGKPNAAMKSYPVPN